MLLTLTLAGANRPSLRSDVPCLAVSLADPHCLQCADCRAVSSGLSVYECVRTWIL